MLRTTGLACALAVAAPLISLEGDDALVIPSEPAVPKGDSTVSAGIDADELRGHVKALSADALQGRPMGSDESLVAAKYCADRFAEMGVAPGAEDGTYYQRIELAGVEYEAAPELVVRFEDGDEETLHYGEAFSFRSIESVRDTGELSCVFVTKESEIPETADRSIALVFATSPLKTAKWLRAAGHPRGAGFGLVVVPRKRSDAGERSMPNPQPVRAVNSSRGTVNATLVGDWGARAYEGKLRSVRLVPHAKVNERVDVNVVGVIEGTKEGADREFVVLSAHRDHVGLLSVRPGAEAPDDIIRNGADDDASGCAAVLEIAEALAAGPKPERTVVVMLVTGEEVGFVGSEHWVANPTVPMDRVVCAFNFEMLGRPDDLVGGAGNIWLTGDERSSLGPKLRAKGIDVSPDPRPSFNFFVRSDNVPFAKAGIVAQTLSSYGEHRDYHQPSDEWDTLDYEHMQTAVRECAKAVVELVVEPDWTPKWNDGEPKF